MTRQERLDHIRTNPDLHKHKDLGELTQCCMVDGSIDALVWEAHQGLLGSNGGRSCDVKEGPCSCGAFH